MTTPAIRAIKNTLPRSHITLLTASQGAEVAHLVREHIVTFEGEDPAVIREAEVVNYADKRVLHTRVVTLAARFADLKERYAKSEEARRRLAALKEKAQKFEIKLFYHLNYSPADLLQLNHTRREL